MPIMDGRTAAKEIRKLEKRTPQPDNINPLRVDGRIPIFAVSASLYESDRTNMAETFDGWMLKPLGKHSRMRVTATGANRRFQSDPYNLVCFGGSCEAIQGSLRAGPVGEGRLPHG